MARRTQVLEVTLAALMLVGFLPTQNRAVAATMQVLTTAPAATRQRSALADRVDNLLTGTAPEARRLRVFVRGLSTVTGWAREGCPCPVGRSDGICRLMGELLLRQQALEREGRKPQVAAFLNKLREARSAGLPEAQIRAIVRAGLARGDLRPNADEECRVMRRQVEQLNRQLVGATAPAARESDEPIQISARQ